MLFDTRTVRIGSSFTWFVGVVGAAAIVSWLARGVPNLFLEDDAYFYLQIAWNIATGHGSTFDGLHPTNGYHLLWMAMLTPMAFAVHAIGLGKTTFLVVTCALAIAIASASVVAAFRSSSERALALLLFLSCGITMETTVLAAALLVLTRTFLGELHLPRLVIVLLAALVPLARIDFCWLPLALALAATVSSWERRQLIALTFIGVLLGTLAHFGAERLLFGVWISVSSAHKASEALDGRLRLLAENLSSSGNQLRFFVHASLVALGVVGWFTQAEHRRRPLAMMAIASASLVAYSNLLALRDWYFQVSLVLVLLVASRGWSPTHRVWRWGVMLLAGVVTAASLGYVSVYAADRAQTRQFIRAANAALTPDDVVYQIDGTGFTGWWLTAHVVNGDGLVNSWPYLDALQKGALAGYLEQVGATYVITNRAGVAIPLIKWHGLVVAGDLAELRVDTGPTRNPFERYRLYVLTGP